MTVAAKRTLGVGSEKYILGVLSLILSIQKEQMERWVEETGKVGDGKGSKTAGEE